MGFLDDLGLGFVEDIFQDVVGTLESVFQGIGNVISKVGGGIDKVISGVMKDPLPVIMSVGLTAMGVPPAAVAIIKGAAQGGSMDQMVFNMAAGYAGAEFGAAVGNELFPELGNIAGYGGAGDVAFQTTAADTILKSVITGASASGATALLQGKDTDKVFESALTGAVTGLIKTSLRTEYGLDPSKIGDKFILDAASAAAKGVFNGSFDPATALGMAIGNTVIGTATNEAASGLKTTVKNLTDSTTEFNRIDGEAKKLKTTEIDPETSALTKLAGDLNTRALALDETRKDLLDARDAVTLAQNAFNDPNGEAAAKLAKQSGAFQVGDESGWYWATIDRYVPFTDDYGNTGYGPIFKSWNINQAAKDLAETNINFINTNAPKFQEDYLKFDKDLGDYNTRNNTLTTKINTYNDYLSTMYGDDGKGGLSKEISDLLVTKDEQLATLKDNLINLVGEAGEQIGDAAKEIANNAVATIKEAYGPTAETEGGTLATTEPVTDIFGTAPVRGRGETELDPFAGTYVPPEGQDTVITGADGATLTIGADGEVKSVTDSSGDVLHDATSDTGVSTDAQDVIDEVLNNPSEVLSAKEQAGLDTIIAQMKAGGESDETIAAAIESLKQNPDWRSILESASTPIDRPQVPAESTEAEGATDTLGGFPDLATKEKYGGDYEAYQAELLDRSKYEDLYKNIFPDYETYKQYGGDTHAYWRDVDAANDAKAVEQGFPDYRTSQLFGGDINAYNDSVAKDAGFPDFGTYLEYAGDFNKYDNDRAVAEGWPDAATRDDFGGDKEKYAEHLANEKALEERDAEWRQQQEIYREQNIKEAGWPDAATYDKFGGDKDAWLDSLETESIDITQPDLGVDTTAGETGADSLDGGEGNDSVDSVTCPDGFIYDPTIDACIPITEDKPVDGTIACPDGYELDPETNTCVPVKSEVEDTTYCDEGYTYDPELGVCVPDIVVPQPVECEEGYVYDEITGTCVPETITPPPKSVECEEGYVYDEATGMCVPETITPPPPPPPPPGECEEGYVYDEATGMCVPETIVTPPAVECEEGYVYDAELGVCVPETIVPPPPPPEPIECEEGYVYDEATGMCIPETIVPPPKPPEPVECEEGYVYDEATGMCVPEIITPPPPPPPPVECEEGYVYNEELRICVPEVVPPPDIVDCEDGYKYDPITKTCVPDVPEPIECEDGYKYDPVTQMCVPDVPQPIECEDGYKYDPVTQTCVPDVPEPIECEEGYVYDAEKGMCVPEVITPPPITCPAGQVYDPVQKACVPITQQPPPKPPVQPPPPPPKPPTCPTGYTYDATLKQCVPVKQTGQTGLNYAQLLELLGGNAPQPFEMPFYFELPEEEKKKDEFDITKAFSPTLYKLFGE